MDIAALIFWIATAGGGFYLLGTWIAKGGARGESNFPPPLILGHFALAAVGLIVWIVYVASDSDAAGWIAFVLLAAVALLGFTMFARWVPTYRAGRTPSATTSGGGSGTATSNVATQTTTAVAPAERHFPLVIVLGHGLLAATTLVLVLLAVLGS
ncbi:MAG TPA: hypothetical protein VE442_17820 [Jatrophihabitans sp.]|nr:hypothetical protein [Jatrophihabitans sp.]